MCILFLHFLNGPRLQKSKYWLILAANRDEFFSRPSRPAEFWEDHKHVIGGRDLTKGREGGTWLAMSKGGKIGMLTNFPEKESFTKDGFVEATKPRGQIVVNYLADYRNPKAYISELLSSNQNFSSFNILLGEFEKETGFNFCYGSNAGNLANIELEPGAYGLSNAEIDCSWTKVQKGKHMFQEIVSSNLEKDELVQKLFHLMQNNQVYHPDNGGSHQHLPEELVAPLSSIFVSLPKDMYGTRTITLILVDNESKVTFIEKTMMDPLSTTDPNWQTRSHEFFLEEDNL